RFALGELSKPRCTASGMSGNVTVPLRMLNVSGVTASGITPLAFRPLFLSFSISAPRIPLRSGIHIAGGQLLYDQNSRRHPKAGEAGLLGLGAAWPIRPRPAIQRPGPHFSLPTGKLVEQYELAF